MKVHLIPLLLVGVALAATTGHAQSAEQTERLAAAFALALGRLPSADEAKVTDAADRSSLASLYAKHGQRLNSDAEARRAVVARACEDAFARQPTPDELTAWSAGQATYSDLMRQHLAALAKNPATFREIIDAAYRHVINRPAYDLELDYWKARGPLPYVLLVGAIENWAQRNAPGLTVTSGTPTISINSRLLHTIRLSPPVANEARVLLGLPVWTDVARLKNPGCNLVAVGGGEIASLGGISFALVGR